MTAPANCPPTPDMAVEIDRLEVRFDDFAALRGVTLRIPVGKTVAVIGPNGSGKTTLLRCLLGLQKPSAGSVRLFGSTSIQKQLHRVGYVPQKIQLDSSFMLSVREFLSLKRRETRHWFWTQNRFLEDFLEAEFSEIKVLDLLDRPVASLSGGQLQRVLIAFSLLNKPDLLLLDEPTAGVDSTGEQSFYELIENVHQHHAMTVVLVSHDLSMVYRHASWVYAMNGVVCCEGKPEEVMNADSLKEAYGIHVTPYHHQHTHHVH